MDQMPMWSVYVSFSEPLHPPGVQRVGKRQGLTVSVRAGDEAAAKQAGAACAKRKGCKRARGEWAVKMGVE